MSQLIQLIAERSTVLTLVVAAAVLLTLYIVGILIYNIIFHPLHKFPGPWTYAASRLPYMQDLLSGNLPSAVRVLHEKYGDVVRIAPDELSFRTPEAWKDIYSRRGIDEFPKDRRVYIKSFGDTHSLIQENAVNHSRVRKLISHGFAEKALLEQEPLMQGFVDLLIQRLKERAPMGKPVDMVSWYNWTSFDIIGDLAFGEPFGCLQDSEYHPWVSLIFGHIKTAAYSNAVLRIPGAAKLLQYITPKRLLEQRESHFELTKAKVMKRLQRKMDRPDFLGYILRANNTEKGMSVPEIIVNSGDFIIAGSETTATLLAGCTYYLLTNPEKMAKLVAEIRGAFTSDSEITITRVHNLPYLVAVLNETLRMYPPVPVGLPRIVTGEGAKISGVWVPGGTAVAVAPMAASRDPKNFRNADSFCPERYLDDPYFANDKKAASQPFSVGPRNCIGQSLAYAEMRVILARVLYNFNLDLDPSAGKWIDQQVFLLWQKLALPVIVKPVERS